MPLALVQMDTKYTKIAIVKLKHKKEINTDWYSNRNEEKTKSSPISTD